MGRDGEREKEPISVQLMEGTGDDPSGKPDPGEGWGNGSDAEQFWSLAGDQCKDGPTKKKVRKRMGMWGFGERERKSHCEGQLAGRNQKKGESEIATEREGKVGRGDEESLSDCCKEVTEKRPEMPKSSTVANSRTEGTLDTAWGLASQPRRLPSAPDLCCSTPSPPLDSIPEEEPSQPGRNAPHTVGQQPFPAGKTIAGATKTSPSTTHTEKTAGGEDTSPCGTGEEASAKDVTGAASCGSRGVPCAELGDTGCQAWRGEGGRRTGNPCAVQEEDCDLGITVLEEEARGPGRRGASSVQSITARASSDPGASPVSDPLEAKTAHVPCGAAVRAPSESTPLPAPSLLLGAEHTGPGSPQRCTTPLQGGPAAEDNAEPLESEEKTRGDTGESVKTQWREAVTETVEAPAAGLTGSKASPEEHCPPPQHCVTVSVDVHVRQADCRTETQRASDQASNMNPDTGGQVLQNMVVSSHDVQDTGSECGHQSPVCVSVSPPVCEDRTLPCDTDLVQNFSTQPFTAQSPKPRDDPDSVPSLGSLSDSQLNSITLSETEDHATDPADEQEDASELVCGLIKELSSLNQSYSNGHPSGAGLLPSWQQGPEAAPPPSVRLPPKRDIEAASAMVRRDAQMQGLLH
ncbi:hypothetical protein AAFF_G00215510 [Aldrovandia affinis]|uniref:Uncharacterized protein n=1 Tax=Aldrovandia affinis TaxID=143900 RepID=A0AAD7RGF8_9TELE|nr:hypothetical protein AAFF_G00215510 [Aldrovandia affinis]